MEINKQLFEDVLSGKLKGNFVLSNGSKVRSEKCERLYSFRKYDKKSYTFYDGQSGLWFDYYEDGRFSNFNIPSANDIVDFIPDTDMKENELTIEIPDNKIIDWDESKKQNKIVLKDKQLTYEDICNRLQGMIDITLFNTPSKQGNVLVADVHHLECLLAKNHLANVAKYLNGEWKPDKTDLGHFDAWVLYTTPDNEFIGYVKISNCAYHSNALFKSKELAQQAIEILGEETVKLALEPLGI